MSKFLGYLTGQVIFFDAMGVELCRTENIIFLYQFSNTAFGRRYMEAEVTRDGVIASFMLQLDYPKITRTGIFGPSSDMPNTTLFPVRRGGNFFLNNFFFHINPGPPEILGFVEEMGSLKS